MKNYNSTSHLSVQCVNNTAVPCHVHLMFHNSSYLFHTYKSRFQIVSTNCDAEVVCHYVADCPLLGN